MAPLFSDFYHVHRSYYREDSICLFGGSFQDLVRLNLEKWPQMNYISQITNTGVDAEQ